MVNLTGGDHWRVLSNATEVHRLVVSRIPDAIPERFAGCALLQAASTLLMTNHCYNTPHDESPLQAASTFLIMNQRFAKSKRHSIMSYKKPIRLTPQKSTFNNHKLEIFRQLFLSIIRGSTEYSLKRMPEVQLRPKRCFFTRTSFFLDQHSNSETTFKICKVKISVEVGIYQTLPCALFTSPTYISQSADESLSRVLPSL